MDTVILIDKSLQERQNEYLEIFAANKTHSPATIRKEWSFYLELSMDSSGWQAVWKVPRATCQTLSMPFPSLILVYVESIDFADQNANVKVIAVQNDIEIQEMHQVPLMQLWPTKEQDKSIALFMDATANALDMYRFFYTNIFLPWDHDDDDSYWLENNLGMRLRLFYDMKNGVIPREPAEHIRFLLTEARRIAARRESIQLALHEEDSNVEDNPNNEQLQQLMSLNIDLIGIKGEIELLENPVTRSVIINRMKEAKVKVEMQPAQFWIVFESGKLDDYFKFLQQLQRFHADETFKFTSSLQTILDGMNVKDTVILSPKMHAIKTTSGLECGGTLKGIYERQDTTLTTKNEDIMLDFKGHVTLENLTINAANSQCGILIRAGKTKLKNCGLFGDNTSSTHQGIIVLNGGQLEMENCTISGFSTAIVGNSASDITLKNCEIGDVSFALKIYDFCRLNAENCNFHHCHEYAMCVETNSETKQAQNCGDFSLLQIFRNVELNGISGNDNRKGDVLINPLLKIAPKTDLFSNSSNIFNDCKKRTRKSSEQSQEDDMDYDQSNVTVIEACLPNADDDNNDS